MTLLANTIDCLDWIRIETRLDSEGYALLPGLLSAAQSQALMNTISGQSNNQMNGLTNGLTLRRITLTDNDPGRGQLFFFNNQLPEVLATLRAQLYRHLMPIANHWNHVLNIGYRYPDTLDGFLQSNCQAGQERQLSHLHRLKASDYLALHQWSDGELVFPLQVLIQLTEPERDFSGGQWVMTEQRPRMQSRPIVLSLHQGDVAIICTARRPIKGSQGFYRVNMKHAISRVRGGQRIGLELFFHHAPGSDQKETHEQATLLDLDRP
ncbi:2OG-Fe(II) oxygenase [Advenella mimigardefordensis]|nr:2OG-Fe(II) oxygenase [Advenella mimigardefordensis]